MRARRWTGPVPGIKSFWVLFFKKEHLAFWLVFSTASAREIKLATWNLDWLTARQDADLPADVSLRAPEDFARLHAYAQRLAADVVAFQEVDGVASAARVFDPGRYALVTIDEPVVQQVGVAVRRDIGVVRHPDVAALDVEPFAKYRLRNGLDVTLRFADGTRLRLLVVHLKTGCQFDPLDDGRREACSLLAEQVGPLVDWVAARQREGGAFAVLGDFNRVMDAPEAVSEALLGAAPLVRVTEGRSDPCWDGGPFIDHIFLGGAARDWLVAGSLRVLRYRETDPGMKDRISDHCPVSVRLDIP